VLFIWPSVAYILTSIHYASFPRAVCNYLTADENATFLSDASNYFSYYIHNIKVYCQQVKYGYCSLPCQVVISEDWHLCKLVPGTMVSHFSRKTKIFLRLLG